ncbi:MAG: hypothetical protein ACREWG_08660 [Gammaproteobacteria bacterium]
MKTVGIVAALVTIGCALYALYWARKEEVVQPVVQHEEDVAAGEAEGEEATEIGPGAGSEDAAIQLESEKTPEGVS